MDDNSKVVGRYRTTKDRPPATNGIPISTRSLHRSTNPRTAQRELELKVEL